MRSFACDVCQHLLFFENSICVSCGTPQGFDSTRLQLVAVPYDGSARICANLDLAGCNWLVPGPDGDDETPTDPGPADLCRVCRLTRTRPTDDDGEALAAFARVEAAKRRFVYQMLDLGLPVVSKWQDPVAGLAFDLLSSAQAPVVTGHEDGLVTIDLAEGQDAHREAMRVQMAEPYRTVLGHVRHESGHYYWSVLVEGNGLAPTAAGTLDRFRELFGDERQDYGAALQRHYAQGPPAGWGEQYVSAYATSHPWEDWAETFAHYLHIVDTIQTASAYGLLVAGPDEPVKDADTLVALPQDDPTAENSGIAGVIATWLPLTYALNAVNRSMGKDDLYPFLLTETVIGKLGFVHQLVAPLNARVSLPA